MNGNRRAITSAGIIGQSKRAIEEHLDILLAAPLRLTPRRSVQSAGCPCAASATNRISGTDEFETDATDAMANSSTPFVGLHVCNDEPVRGSFAW
jgi:hypothetical protein